MDDERTRAELAGFLEENRSEIAERVFASIIETYPHMAGAILPENGVKWVGAELDGLIDALSRNCPNDLSFEVFYGLFVTQSTDIFRVLFNHLEWTAFFSESIAVMICEKTAPTSRYMRRLVKCLEDFTLLVLQSDMHRFAEEELRPGLLLRNIDPAILLSDCMRDSADNGPENLGENRSMQELTAREGELCRLVAKGLTNKEIASQCGISVATVKNHISNILMKLDLGNRTELALWFNQR